MDIFLASEVGDGRVSKDGIIGADAAQPNRHQQSRVSPEYAEVLPCA